MGMIRVGETNTTSEIFFTGWKRGILYDRGLAELQGEEKQIIIREIANYFWHTPKPKGKDMTEKASQPSSPPRTTQPTPGVRQDPIRLKCQFPSHAPGPGFFFWCGLAAWRSGGNVGFLCSGPPHSRSCCNGSRRIH